jgi:polyvinyl alcohol dehydrogenase (cytochrome)
MKPTVLSLFVVFAGAAGSPAAAQQTPNGEAIYAENCARCHDTALPQMPPRAALRDYTPEMIETALSSFTMRSEAAHLSQAERRAVAEFLSARPAGSYKAPLDVIAESAYCAKSSNVTDPLAGDSWNGWGAGPTNARFQPAEAAGLTRSDVPRLKLKWAFGVPGVAASGSQVTVVGRRAFFGTRNGMVYSLDAETGCLAWAFEADGGVRSTPTVVTEAGTSTVYFGDAHARIYALDALSGAVRWTTTVDEHVDAMITGGAVFHEGRLYVPVSSLEEGSAVVPTYECCTFIGSLVALDARNGREIWRTRTIARGAEPTGRNDVGTQMWGPSGAAIWSAPTLDPARNRIYVTTGDNYSNPPVATSDAIMALALDTGRILWSQQTLPGDAWNVSCLAAEGESLNCPESAGPDHDFGSSAVLTTRANGSRILLAGQKSGVLYGLDPDDGRLIWERRVGDGGVLGGIEWGFATDGGAAYVSVSEALEKEPGDAGGISAIDIDDGAVLWETAPAQDSCVNRKPCSSGQPGAVTAIPGVVFSGSLDGHVRAYDSTTGEVVWDFDTVREFATVNGVPAHGGSLNGPGVTVVGGTVFVSSGYSPIGFMPGNVVLAFSAE